MIIPKEFLKTTAVGLGLRPSPSCYVSRRRRRGGGRPGRRRAPRGLRAQPGALEGRRGEIIAGRQLRLFVARARAVRSTTSACAHRPTSFADIFFNNCFKNGMLPITLARDEVGALLAHARGRRQVTVDLEAQTVRRADGEGPLARRRPLPQEQPAQRPRRHGLTLLKTDAIADFRRAARRGSWLDGATTRVPDDDGSCPRRAASRRAGLASAALAE